MSFGVVNLLISAFVGTVAAVTLTVSGVNVALGDSQSPTPVSNQALYQYSTQ